MRRTTLLAATVLGFAGLTACQRLPPPPPDHVVDSPADAPDASPGDGLCASAAGQCTLRAAATEASLAYGDPADPPNPQRVVSIAPGVNPVLTAPILFSGTEVRGNGNTIHLGGVADPVQACHGRFTLRDTTLTGSGPGGALSHAPGCQAATMAVRNVAIVDGAGSGIDLGFGDSVLEVRATTIARNAGSGITGNQHQTTVTDSTVIDNGGDGVHQWGGGAIVVSTSTVSGNGSNGVDNGGGSAIVYRSTVASNGFAGVAAQSGDSKVHSSTITGHSFGVLVGFTDTSVVNTTLADNDTAFALWGTADVELRSSTVTGPGHLLSYDDHTLPVLSVSGSVLDLDGACGFDEPVRSLGWNVVSDVTCGFDGAGDQQDTDPQLGALGDNGGFTATHAPAGGSPVVDTIPAGTPDLCDGTRVDQRGVGRPQGGACDAGSVELAGQ